MSISTGTLHVMNQYVILRVYVVKGLLYRVPECLSSRLNWVPLEGGHTHLWGGGGGPNSDDSTETLVIYIQYIILLRICRLKCVNNVIHIL